MCIERKLKCFFYFKFSMIFHILLPYLKRQLKIFVKVTIFLSLTFLFIKK